MAQPNRRSGCFGRGLWLGVGILIFWGVVAGWLELNGQAPVTTTQTRGETVYRFRNFSVEVPAGWVLDHSERDNRRIFQRAVFIRAGRGRPVVFDIEYKLSMYEPAGHYPAYARDSSATNLKCAYDVLAGRRARTYQYRIPLNRTRGTFMVQKVWQAELGSWRLDSMASARSDNSEGFREAASIVKTIRILPP